MFNDLNKQAPSSTSVDDIFAETDIAAHSSAAKVNIEAQAAGLSAQAYPESDTKKNPEHSGSKLKFILIIVLAIIILASAAYLVYAKLTRDAAELTGENKAADTPPAAEKTVDSFNNPADSMGSVVVPEVENNISENSNSASTSVPDLVDTNAAATVTPALVAPVDSDGDSLTDAEENGFGTNINLIDSDFDGLSDYEELKVYKTNPLNPDSDGDGYNDGDEVKNGYNPNGEGKL